VQFVAAFKKLGYDLANPRQDWSAAKTDGVCITIWRKERGVKDGLPYMDLWELPSEDAEWRHKPGHVKRTGHLKQALTEFDGKVDVIFLTGEPGVGYENAVPWVVDERGASWHITKFDEATGNFRAEIDKSAKTKPQG
jgi:hypothetical protein